MAPNLAPQHLSVRMTALVICKTNSTIYRAKLYGKLAIRVVSRAI
jgi:hypothetical protein